MFAVAFEVLPSASGYQRYLDIAAALRPKLERIDGFLSIERFRSLTHPGWILSLSLWRDEAALVEWRSEGEHHAAQAEGRQSVFDDYRLRVVHIGDVTSSGKGALLGLREYASALPVASQKRFQSLVDPGKQIALEEFADTCAAHAWQEACERDAPASRILLGHVVRDYGLFARAQAPQVFPSVKR